MKFNKLIEEAFTKTDWKYLRGKSKKSRLLEAEKLSHWFEKDYIANKDILNTEVEELVKDPDELSYNIIEGIRSYSNDKYSLVMRIEVLSAYLLRQMGVKLELEGIENFKTKDKNERIMKILKYLHEGSHSRAEIAETFGISERTLSDDLKELFDGYEYMGSSMKIKEIERGSNVYRSQIHPVFQALHMKEIYSMTVGLKLLGKGTVFEYDYDRIANQVYTQLSEKAKATIDLHAKTHDLNFTEDDLSFNNSYVIAMRERRPFTYFLKESIPCCVTYEKNGEILRDNGVLKLGTNEKKIAKELYLQKEDESIELKLDCILSINAVSNE